MTLMNYARPEAPETLEQNFRKGYFTSNAFGEYEILLKSSEPIDRGSDKIMTQALYAKTLWKPIPGKTYAESSQINATIVYVVRIADQPDAAVVSQTGETTLRYEGTGFICFKTDRSGNVLTGTIEQALLKPIHLKENYRLGTFELNGAFQARRDLSAIAEFKITLGASSR
jgi:hypothetical protein